MTEPIAMPTPNHYWEERSGVIKKGLSCFACKSTTCGGGILRFPGKRAKMDRRENRGGVGRKVRRKTRKYANPKLARNNRGV